ncbi:Pkinase-domain-containing protein [Imleria badia]|nr:Pkinase-domain-containing protein [Imleria badia]
MANPSSSSSDDLSSSPIASFASESDRGRSRVRRRSNQHNEHHTCRRGYHTFMSSFGKPFHVEKRWKLVRELGSGAYGVVVSAADEISHETVAIKLVTRVFEKVQLAKRALREITLLRHFAHHENITGLIDVDAISPDFQEMWVTFVPMEADLHQIIKSGQALTNEHVQYFLYQILRGMKYIHTASVIHRDLKPGNLLVNSDCELKICDFGLSRGFDAIPDEHTSGHLTEYVATRWYRAPEIMLAFRGYTTAIDVWSIGCIFAELLLGRPLFKGKDYVDQLNKILDVLGTPDESVIHRIGSEKAQAYIQTLPVKPAIPLRKLLPTADIQGKRRDSITSQPNNYSTKALDLLEKMIAFDPSSRITIPDALSHPWLAAYHDESDEPDCPEKFEKWREIEKLETLDEFRDALWKEIEDYRMEVRGMKPETSPFPSVAEKDQVQSSPSLSPVKSLRSPTTDRDSKFLDADHLDTLAPPTITGSETFHATEPTDPVVTYARRSSFIPPGRHSTSPMASTVQHPLPAVDGLPTTSNAIEFPSETYVVPARSRAPSTTGGDITVRKLLRTLSTVSIHESAEGLPGGLAGVALIGRYITDREADAPISEMPLEFAGKRGQDIGRSDGQ